MGSVVAAMWRAERDDAEVGTTSGGSEPELRLWHVSPGARAAAIRRRSLHLVDLENVCGGAHAVPGDAVAGLWRYLDVAGWRDDDHVVIAAHPSLVIAVGFARLVPARLLPATGVDGADLALLRHVAAGDVAARYDRVVVGSGDHAFAALIEALADLGVDVSVVARPGSVSHELFVHRDRLGLPTGDGATPTAPAPIRPLATKDRL
jgi:hypothetical protein